jgi:carbamoyltransferase
MAYLGISGFPGLDPNPYRHIRAYSRRHEAIGLALGDLGHDAAAVLVEDGRIQFAVEEERLNRSKHFMGLARLAVGACSAASGGSLAGVELAYYLDPGEDDLRRRVEAFAEVAGASSREAVEREFAQARELIAASAAAWPGLRGVDHHLAHAASAFYPSGFERALVVVVDGQGESTATSVLIGDERGLHPLVRHPVTSSLGHLYAALTAYLGFEPIEDEYKVMGLAAYGQGDEFRPFFDELVRVSADGFSMPGLFAPAVERLPRWAAALGWPRGADEPIEDRHIAIAHSLQCATERLMMGLLERFEGRHRTRHLCLAGGVALNCSMNGLIDRSGLFDRIFVQPAANDPGAALGAALLRYHADHPGARGRRLEHVYLGPEYDEAAIRAAIASFGTAVVAARPRDYTGEVARLLAGGNIVGWFQGRMEFGPRALGNRSILADPRRADMKDRVNRAVKKREEFRPFAPSVPLEHADRFFQIRAADQHDFMTIAVRARPGRAEEIPAVVHVNGTARVQVVRRETNPAYWELLERFGRETGVPVLLNTSFNVRGEPIVCSPEDAIRCFLGTGLDYLAMSGTLISRPGPAGAGREIDPTVR